ncbi:hypothetical protein H663_018960 [Limnohabitans planktonicus II-D5]|uniref:Uncharacterized protein n=1 Tax=Limnohabitans planktonicus II-D5 TaxID=1293045 RepID=A0A2T7U8Z2_9BURK|nr:hypothetical protein H663_018960 [Limnohabitans planktonicus II-D5]
MLEVIVKSDITKYPIGVINALFWRIFFSLLTKPDRPCFGACQGLELIDKFNIIIALGMIFELQGCCCRSLRGAAADLLVSRRSVA